MRDRLMLEESEKMCEYCCNFDKEHIKMDCTALCKLTMTLAYAEDYGGNCMFYNVPKEQIIVPPCKVGDTVYSINRKALGGHWEDSRYIVDGWSELKVCEQPFSLTLWELGWKDIFLTREEAEKALKEREKE